MWHFLSLGITTNGFSSDGNLHFHSYCAWSLIFQTRLVFVSLLLADEVFPEGDATTKGDWVLEKLDQWKIDETRRAGITIDGAERAMARHTGLPYLWCPAHCHD